MKKENIQIEKKQPVVVILGHIDHGKTSLLRALKNLPFSAQKPGGLITQEIGAFEVKKEGKEITFLDTPGHEAFSQMRTRGAKVADLAVLVVSAVEGPKEQTKEAVSILKEAKIPFIVAINKVDLPGADPLKTKRELQKIGILIEEFGGSVPTVLTSAKTGEGLQELLDLILLLAEIQDLKLDLSPPAKGVIIEAKLDSKRGPIATGILEKGILKVGDIIGTQSAIGKVKSLESAEKEKLKSIFPGKAALILGFETVPEVGEVFQTFESLEKAKENIVKKEQKPKVQVLPKEGQKVLNLILKADCLGSLEAIEEMIEKIPQEKVVFSILKKEVGLVSEEDVKLSKTTGAFILAFRTGPDKIVKKLLEREKLRIFSFSLIYDLLEKLRKIAKLYLEPEVTKIEIGKLKVLVNFWREKNRQIVGGKIIEGKVKRQVQIEVWRGENLVGKGKLINLQKNKKDIQEAQKGEEVGILFEGDVKIKEDDILVFILEEKRKIEF
ncbi:translation initiation factor IF-2 [Candidatus Parcubacteria bacterium]|nr:translation initiation factor IF-2 [Candidatus Parcubacteria bacterium]